MADKLSLEKIKGVPQTLLIPLRGRYLETKRKGGIISDPKAVEIIDAIEHDFAENDLPWDSQIMISTRTEIFDQAANKFLEKNPNGVIVNLGSGLDARGHRVDNGSMLWYDLDLDECIELRKKFFKETDRIRFISKSVLDFSWMDMIEKNRPVLFIAEGLLHYLEESDVKDLMAELESNFPNSEFVFEIYSPMITGSWHRHPHIRNAFSMFKWGLNTGKTLEKWSKGIRFLTEWHYLDRHPKRWRWMRFARAIPSFRKVMKAVHLQFTPILN